MRNSARLGGPTRMALVLLGAVLPLSTSLIPTDSTLASWLLVAAAGLGIAMFATATGYPPTAVVYSLAGAVGAFVLAALLGSTPALSLLGRYPRYEGLVTVLGYGLALVAGSRLLGPDARRERRLFASATAVAALVTVVVCLAQVALDPESRVIGLLGNSSILGSWAVWCLAVLGWRLTAERRALEVAGLAASFIVLILSASRAAWLGAAVALVGMLVVRLGSRVRPRWWLAPIGLAVLGLTALLVPVANARLTGTTPFAAASAEGRLLLWSDSRDLWLSRPLLGGGPSTFVDAIGAYHSKEWAAAVGPYAPPDSAHNLILQVLTSTGFVGLVGVLAVVTTVMVALLRTRPWSEWQAGALTAATGLGVAYLFSYTDPVNVTLLMLTLGGAVAVVPRRSPMARRVGRIAMVVWLAAALVTSGSVMVGEAQLSAGVGAVDSSQLVAAADNRRWDPDLAIRAGRILNQMTDQDPSAARAAVKLLGPACAQLPRSTECLQVLGEAQTLTGDADEALRTLERALAADPVNVDTILKLGIAAAESGDADAAESWFHRATELRPTAPEPWDDLATLYRRAGRERDAAAAEATAERIRQAEQIRHK